MLDDRPLSRESNGRSLPLLMPNLVRLDCLVIIVLFSLFCACCVFGNPDGLGCLSVILRVSNLSLQSRWVSFCRVAYIAPCWLFLVMAGTSTTQGALTSAVSKAFSSVNSQLEKLSEIKARERSKIQK
jgi:hypothetical protein